jgi:hypothetical protein
MDILGNMNNRNKGYQLKPKQADFARDWAEVITFISIIHVS